MKDDGRQCLGLRGHRDDVGLGCGRGGVDMCLGAHDDLRWNVLYFFRFLA